MKCCGKWSFIGFHEMAHAVNVGTLMSCKLRSIIFIIVAQCIGHIQSGTKICAKYPILKG